MKVIKSIFLLCALMLFSVNLYSQDINSPKKNRLLIYDFITTDNYDNVKEKEKNYQYYSIVIPETISKSLSDSGNYTIKREAGPFSIDADFINKKEKTKYIKKLGELGLQNKSDYVITGRYNVVKNKILIDITIFDVYGKEIKKISHESDELGVQMQRTTDIISQLVGDEIKNLYAVNQKKINRSPFLALYKPFSIMSIGLDSGYLYIKGDWSSKYNNVVYISPFIDFDLIKNLSLSLKATSIQSDSEDKDYSSYSQIKMLSGSISLAYMLKFTDNFGLTLSAGGGMTQSTITLFPEKPFMDSASEEESIDPNIDLSSYFVYNFSTFTLRAGILYKRVFFNDNPMDTGVVFAGAGIHF